MVKQWANYMLRHRNYIFIVLLVLLTLRVIVPQLDDLKESIQALKDADPTWIIFGTVVFFIGVPVLALQYMSLALKSIPFGLTLKVEMAGLFVSKLLPSALGSVSLNMYYLIKKDHSPGQAATVVTTNAMTSATAYSILIIAALIASDLSLKGLNEAINVPDNLIFLICIFILGLCYIAYKSSGLRGRLRKAIGPFKQNFSYYRKKPTALLFGMICNFFGSLTSLFALYASAHAIGVDLNLAGALLAYTFGNIAAAIVPTPGGLGATEAGLYSGLVLVGIDGPSAIIITLLYRLITYWLPIIPGYYFFWDLRKTVLSSFNIKKRYT